MKCAAWDPEPSHSRACWRWPSPDAGRATARTTPAPWRSASTPRSRPGTARPRATQLNAETASKLEKQEQKPCAEAILSLELPKGGTVADTRVYVTSALATLAEGGSDFLDEGPDGWRVSAAGCEPTAPSQPYDCELEN